ncbi:MAG TPA: tetratricopeptide repeat protein [candidate division Zixibacteria bacterium]|nr:tetratricopeptide repeat protein [candidate division Zixibacteria bacterium]HEQ98053.1 tetratricopeptide repeat protein [candidate division Zixibacteria bacterium]
MITKTVVMKIFLAAVLGLLIAGTSPLAAQDNTAAEHFNNGVDAEAAGNTAKAIEEYRAAIAADSSFASPYYNLGVIYYSQKKFTDALKMFERVTQLEPDNLDAWKNMGLSATETGDLSKGEKAFTEALKIKSNDPELTELFAMLFYKNEAYKRAIAKLEDLVKLKNQDKKTFYALGKSYKEAGNNEQAIVNLQSATKIDPEYQMAYFELGNIYLEDENWSKAMQNYEKSVQYDPDHYQSWFNLGSACVGESTESSIVRAYEAYQKFLSLTNGRGGSQIKSMRNTASNISAQLRDYFDQAGIIYDE